MNHQALAQAIYEANEWSGCNGSRWDALPAEAQCFRVDAAAAFLATLEAAGFAVVQLPEPELVNQCGCHACYAQRGESPQFMVLCPSCGCKRCPKATNHLHACTKSNDSGQHGSRYGVACELQCCKEYVAHCAQRRAELDEILGGSVSGEEK